jgi:hypothetical protein
MDGADDAFVPGCDMTVYIYKKSRQAQVPIPSTRPRPEPDRVELLSGNIAGVKAAKGEERFYRAMMKDPQVKQVWFRLPLGAPKGMPGWKELDFLVLKTSGMYSAFSVKDVTFVHAGTAKTATDLMNDMVMVQALKSQGINVNDIITIDARDLDDEELAARTEKELI